MSDRRPRLSLAAALAVISVLFSIPLAATAQAEDLTVLNQIRERHEHMHQQVSPAVVAVESGKGTRGMKDAPKFYGTGVVVSPDGLVLTSSTVVPATTKFVQVYFSDGKVMDAKVLATD